MVLLCFINKLNAYHTDAEDVEVEEYQNNTLIDQKTKNLLYFKLKTNFNKQAMNGMHRFQLNSN